VSASQVAGIIGVSHLTQLGRFLIRYLLNVFLPNLGSEREVKEGSCQTKSKLYARHRWHTAVILVTWEAKIRRTAIQGQPNQTVCKTLSQKYPTHTKKGLAE
jgi:hypothetical protein